MFKLPLFRSNGSDDSNGDGRHRPPQPYSQNTLEKRPRLDGATVTHSVCPYCAVGCATDIYTKAGEVIDVEGNPDGPINEGTLCPKGANIFQLHHNRHRVKHMLWRPPFAKDWKVVSLDWAMDRIARLVKQTRDEGYIEKNDDGDRVNHVLNIGALGGATLDNEENYLIKKLLGAGLGIISIENQARI
jgi:formate dehydrogenase major subunit